jgi:hypothetical protein
MFVVQWRSNNNHVFQEVAFGLLCAVMSSRALHFRIVIKIATPKTLSLHEQNAVPSGNTEFQTFCDAFRTLDEMPCSYWRTRFERCFSE